MAATTVTKSDIYTGVKPLRTQPYESSVIQLPIPFVLPAAAPVLNDIHLLAKIPQYAKVIDWYIQMPDCDSSTGATIALGEANTALDDLAVVYVTGSALPQAGGLLRAVAATAAASMLTLTNTTYTASADRVITLKWTAAPTGTWTGSTPGLLVLSIAG